MPFRKYTAAQRAAYGRRMAKKRQRNTAPRRSMPARFRGKSAPRYKKSMTLARALAPLAEQKLIGFQNNYPNKMNSAQEFGYVALPLGRNAVPFPSGNFSSEVAASMWNFRQGDAKNERTGRSLFVKGTRVKTRVEYQPHYLSSFTNLKLIVPQFCRYIVVRPKAVNNYNITPDPETDLFLDQNGDQKGVGSVSSDFQLTNLGINRTKYAVMLDRRFTLGPPALSTQNTLPDSATTTNTATRQFTSKYPCHKNVNFNIPMGRKIRYLPGATASAPSDLMDDYWVFLLNTPIGSSINSGSQENMIAGLIGVNLIATTSALDL